MKLNYFFYFLLAVAGFAMIAGGSGCANIIPPTGGPRDSLPPVLLSANPADSTKNFNAKKIILNFNEYVQVDQVQKNLIVSPVPQIPPTVETKLRTLTITVRDTLRPNTTYAFDFGNSIKDINEGNVFRNFTYVFSTGSHLDSLQIGGKVIIAESGKTDSTLIVMLYKNLDDSAVVKEKPRYVARVDSAGNFRFKYLEPGTFAVYAVKDESGARRYQSNKSLFAFYDSTITSQSQKKDILLYAFLPKDTTKPISGSHETAPKKNKEQVNKFLRIGNNLSSGELDLLSNLEITSTEKLEHFDSTKINFTVDSLPAKGYSFVMDTSGRKVILKYPWAEGINYRVIIDSSFAADSAGRRISKNDTLAFQTKKQSAYGLVQLRFIHLPLDKNPVLQFIQGEQVKYSYVFKNNQFYAKLFAPGEYELRIVLDANKNGVWDTGEFFKEHRQPEKVILVPRKINVKPNWDTEVDITL